MRKHGNVGIERDTTKVGVLVSANGHGGRGQGAERRRLEGTHTGEVPLRKSRLATRANSGLFSVRHGGNGELQIVALAVGFMCGVKGGRLFLYGHLQNASSER